MDGGDQALILLVSRRANAGGGKDGHRAVASSVFCGCCLHVLPFVWISRPNPPSWPLMPPVPAGPASGPIGRPSCRKGRNRGARKLAPWG